VYARSDMTIRGALWIVARLPAFLTILDSGIPLACLGRWGFLV
jgi:hypothetical protein